MSENSPVNHPDAPNIPEHYLSRKIGQGSYGDVWIGQNTFGEYRAVKIVYRDRFDDDRPFERELSGIRKVEPVTRKHTGLVDILQIGRTDDYFYYIMEIGDDAERSQINLESYRPKTLSTELAKRDRIPIEEVVRIGRKLSQALAFMHERNLVHRDIKLSNVIYVEGNPKLADVGLVASADASFSLVGTYGYIPREGPGKPPADIYALGKVLYEIATGKDRADFPEIDILDPELIGLNPILLKACEEMPEDRFLRAEDLDEALADLESGEATQTNPKEKHIIKKFGLVFLLALAVITFITIYFWPEDVRAPSGDVTDSKEPETRTQLNKGLIVHLPFDGDAEDVSGYENNGQPNQVTLTSDRSGNKNAAFAFSGNDSYVVIPENGLLNLASEFTISFWFTVEGGSPRGWMHLIAKHRASPGAAGDGFGISIPEAANPNGNLSFIFGQSILRPSVSFHPFDPNKWHHVAIVGNEDQISAYLNNNLIGTTAFNGIIPPNTEPITIGGQNRSFDERNHIGKIDDVRIYRRALSKGEVRTLFLGP